MKIKVVTEFYDKFHTSTLFKEGTVLDFDDERAQNAIAKGLAVAYVEPKKPGIPVKVEQKVEEPQPEVKAEAPKPKAPKVEQPAEKAE